MKHYLGYPHLTDAEWRELRASQDRTTAYDLATKAVLLIIGIVLVFIAMGGADWAVGLL